MEFQAVILAAGRGKRLRPFTDTRPKTLLYLPGGTLLDQQLRLLGELGPARVVVVTGHLAEDVEAHLAGSRAARDLEVETVRQRRPEGLLNALLDALPRVTPPLLVVHGDSFLAGSLEGFAGPLSRGETAIATRDDDDGASPPTKDLVSVEPSGRVTAFGRRVPGALTANSFGCYALGAGLPDLMRDVGGRDIPDVDMIPVFRELLRSGGFMRAIPWAGRHYNLNLESDVLRASRDTLEAWTSLRYARAEEGTWIAPGEVRDEGGARVTGPAWIGSGADVAGATIGPHAAIGADASVRGASVSNAIVYPGSRVDGAVIRDRMEG